MKTMKRNLLAIALASSTAFLAVIAGGNTTTAAAATKKAKPVTTTTAIPASTIPPGKTVNFQATFDPTTLTNAAQECRPSGPDPKGICARIGFAPLNFTGDVSGTALYATANFATSNGSMGTTGIVVFSPESKIADCGTGAFTIGFGPSIEGTKSPSGGSDIPGFWRIFGTSKSSSIATTTGSGLIWAEPLPNGQIIAHVTGTVRC
jgi:hypothetical protein